MLKRRQYRKWALCFTLVLAVPMAAVMLLNYAVDPMWCFNHETPFAVWREEVNYRQQKINLLRFRECEIDTIILGNSKMMIYDPNRICTNGFNLAMPGCHFQEHKFLIDAFYETQKHYPKNIIIGLDFPSADLKKENPSKSAFSSLDTFSWLYRFKILINVKMMKNSIKVVLKNQKYIPKFGDIKYRSGYMEATAFYPSITDMKDKSLICHSYHDALVRIYNNYEYNIKWKEYLTRFIQPPVSATVTPFLVPSSTLLLSIIAEIPGRLDDYERMVREAVEVFGGVWNFMYVNSVNSNHIYWREPTHYLAQVSEWVIDRIYGRGNPPSDFGVYVTAENIDEHLREVRAQIMALPHQKDSWAELMEEE